ncbi:MAG: GNAT family N-acetyltransferase [Magnetococcales bacterium]|nr:GNAT family N-acetyltransferase [Magnetococcales bacterium]
MTELFSERQFFLDAFRGTTLAMVYTDWDADPVPCQSLFDVIQQLVQHDSRVILIYPQRYPVAEVLQQAVAPLVPTQLQQADVQALWHWCDHHAVATHGLLLLGLAADSVATFQEGWQSLLLSARFTRLVLLRQLGGVCDQNGRSVSFIQARRLQRLVALTTSQQPWLRQIQFLLNGGVMAISLCRTEDLEQELLTYQGRGTFFSQRHYCLVRRLNWDDLPLAQQLMYHGVQEGYLLSRSMQAMATILFNGYGAFVNGRHLAGICGLLTDPYVDDASGEVVALYTLTRFQGGGIGDDLLRHVKRAARTMRLRQLFACSRHDRAAAFFRRHGFMSVAHDKVPAAKWHQYDGQRRAQLQALLLPLEV